MKRLILALGFIALTTPAMAETSAAPQGLYLSLGTGITMTEKSDYTMGALSGKIGLDNAANFSAAVGTHLGESVRTELEVSYRDADLHDISAIGVGSGSLSGSLKTTTVLLNGYYDFMADQQFNPYLSAGLGLAHHDGTANAVAGLGFPAESATSTDFAYQAGAGASFKLTDKIALWGGYRFLGSANPDFAGLKAEYHANELRAGVRFNF